MVRIGILIDAVKGSIPASFRERISDYVKTLPEIAFCLEEEDLDSSEALNRIAKRLETEGSGRMVIVGGSPRLYETSFQKLRHGLPLNPYLVAVANIREQALWIAPGEGAALERAKAVISRTVRALLNAKPIETQSLPLKPEVLVLGGGMTGISIAQELAKSGIHVFLVEKGKCLGGKAEELRWFYNRPEQAEDWLKEKVVRVSETPNITILTQSVLKRLDGHLGRFQAKIVDSDRKEMLFSPSAIVVATGFTSVKETKGIYSHRRVITLSQMEKLPWETSKGFIEWEGKKVETVVYLLDEVNEDIKVDSINTIKQALVLREKFGCQVAILCKDAKVAADGMERLYRKARERGVVFFKYEEPPKFSIANGRIQVHVKDTAALQRKDQWPISILSDLIVMSEAFVPTPETKSLSRLLKIHLGNRDFLMEDNPQLLRVRSNRRGIFVAGACRFPQELSESLIEARAVAQEVSAFLSKGGYTYDLAVAEVDTKKCAVCYTCPRLCPHSAITVEKYGERNIYTTAEAGSDTKWGAAKVDPASCYGCGICVAECPAKAITLHHLTDGQIYAQMGLTE